uniref:Secreted protein n=1 Tax=Glossina austeni TaxID=7395 RepID=A0A1A9V5S6_GLOAU
MHLNAQLPQLNLFIFSLAFTTTDSTSTAGSNKTNFATGRCAPFHCGGFANMLMITATARPAFRMGLSIRPPPATIPTIARLAEGTTFLAPDGSFTRVFFVSVLCAITVAKSATENLLNV